jgi:hypothetical protein
VVTTGRGIGTWHRRGDPETANERNGHGDRGQRFNTRNDGSDLSAALRPVEGWCSRHVGRPTAQQMSEQPISGYRLSELRVVPVAADAALVTYFADIKTPGNNAEFHMAVGESWVKRNRRWLIQGYSQNRLAGCNRHHSFSSAQQT